MSGRQAGLFEQATVLPGGLVYQPEFLTAEEEMQLLPLLAGLPLREAEYREYTAKRRIAAYGSRYDFDASRRLAAPPIPDFLAPLRDRVARWRSLPGESFSHALVSEYRPGAALGWHRDVPDFEMIVGVSLGAPARMRFRRYEPRGPRAPVGRRASRAPFDLWLEPRSAYAIGDTMRWGWQHSLPPAPALRYSITFRTLRQASGAGRAR